MIKSEIEFVYSLEILSSWFMGKSTTVILALPFGSSTSFARLLPIFLSLSLSPSVKMRTKQRQTQIQKTQHTYHHISTHNHPHYKPTHYLTLDLP